MIVRVEGGLGKGVKRGLGVGEGSVGSRLSSRWGRGVGQLGAHSDTRVTDTSVHD